MLASLGFIRPGLGEWIVILIIVLVIFGPKRLPEVGEALGKTIKGFRKAMHHDGAQETPESKKNEIEKKD